MSKILLNWSPYQAVKDGVAYPALYIDCGMKYPCCPPWHGRRLAARLRWPSTSGHPVLLRVRAGAFDGLTGKKSGAKQQSGALTFFADQLGLQAGN